MTRTFDDLNEERERLFVTFTKFAWAFTALYFVLDYLSNAYICIASQGFAILVSCPLALWLFRTGKKNTARILIYFTFSFNQYAGFLAYGPEIHIEYYYFSLMASCFLIIDPEEKKTLYSCIAFPMLGWAAQLLGRDFLPQILRADSVTSKYEPIINYLGSAILLMIFLNIFVNMMVRLKVATVREEEEKRQRLQRVHQELESSRASLIHSSKLSSLGEMASGIAHEINNPLAIIELNTVSMRRYLEKKIPDDPKVNKNLGDIENTVRRISKIITGLRVISRKDVKRDFVSVPVRNILEDVLGLCQEKFAVHGVKLIVEDPEHVLDQEISCQQVQLSQVFINLLNNAYDAVNEGSDSLKWIRIAFSKSESQIIIRISNSGEKIAEHVAQRLFEPFFTTKEIGKGTGIGLSISKNIIDDHHGHIFLDPSAENTTFVIRIPFQFRELPIVKDGSSGQLSSLH